MNSKPLMSMIQWCCIMSFPLVCFLAAACVSEGESSLTKALSGAVKDQKISTQKMEYILAEYEKLRDEDKKVARDYAEAVINAIEMGGDSSHIDVARKQVLRRVNGNVKV